MRLQLRFVKHSFAVKRPLKVNLTLQRIITNITKTERSHIVNNPDMVSVLIIVLMLMNSHFTLVA